MCLTPLEFVGNSGNQVPFRYQGPNKRAVLEAANSWKIGKCFGGSYAMSKESISFLLEGSWKSQPHFKKGFYSWYIKLFALLGPVSTYLFSVENKPSPNLLKVKQELPFSCQFPTLGGHRWLLPSWTSKIIQTNIYVLLIHREQLSETITGDSVCSSTIKSVFLMSCLLNLNVKLATMIRLVTEMILATGKKWVKNHSKFHTLLITLD